MLKHLMVVLTNAVEGREDDYNEWYTAHIPDVLKLPGVTSAVRYTLSEAQRMASPPYKYLAIYEIETDDLAAVMAELDRRSGTELMPSSTALAEQRLVLLYKPL